MKRYYICPVVMLADDDGPYYAAKIAQYPQFKHVAEIPSSSDGKPIHDWALCHISGDDFSVLDSDPDIIFVSENPLKEEDVNISKKLKNFCKGKGVDLLDKMKKRDLVHGIGKKLSQNFHEDHFYVA